MTRLIEVRMVRATAPGVWGAIALEDPRDRIIKVELARPAPTRDAAAVNGEALSELFVYVEKARL